MLVWRSSPLTAFAAALAASGALALGDATVADDGTAVAAETPRSGAVETAPTALTVAGDEKPSAVVNRLHEVLLQVLKQADELGYQGRFDRVDPVVDQTFDLDFMAAKAVGRHWKTLTAEEQEQWVGLFGGLTKANYARRFNGFSGQTFELLGQEPASSETIVVRTVLHNPSGDDVELLYRLRETGRGWRIIDIYLDGTVSELALRRSEYSSILKRKGFDALVTGVNQKIGDLAVGTVGQ